MPILVSLWICRCRYSAPYFDSKYHTCLIFFGLKTVQFLMLLIYQITVYILCVFQRSYFNIKSKHICKLLVITTGIYRVAFHRKKLHAKAAFICNYYNVYVLNFFQKPSMVIVPTSQCVYCLMGGRFFSIIYKC